MKVYADKNDTTQVLDVVYRGEKEVYILIDNSGKNENALHFLDLAEHDKQVRKQVCDEIRKQIKPYYGEEISGYVAENVLNQIEKEGERWKTC